MRSVDEVACTVLYMRLGLGFRVASELLMMTAHQVEFGLQPRKITSCALSTHF